MDLQHKMLRSTVDILISKTIVDIQRDTYRSIRNFVDLGVYFAKGENQKLFFKRMQATIQNPQNPFYKLVADMLKNIDIDVIKTLGTNLGCSSFTYGVNMIRENEKRLSAHIPSMLIFDWDDGADPLKAIKQSTELIAQGMELGIFTHVFYANKNPGRAYDVFSIAREFPFCSFFMLVSPQLIDDDFILMSKGVNNVLISVEGSPSLEPVFLDALATLHNARCVYGIHAYYIDETADQVRADSFVDALIDAGCFFLGYIYDRRDKNPDTLSEMRSFVRMMRTHQGKSILAFDWYGDLKVIIDAISKGSDLLKILDKGTARARNGEVSVNVEGLSLEEIILQVMPAIDQEK